MKIFWNRLLKCSSKQVLIPALVLRIQILHRHSLALAFMLLHRIKGKFQWLAAQLCWLRIAFRIFWWITIRGEVRWKIFTICASNAYHTHCVCTLRSVFNFEKHFLNLYAIRYGSFNSNLFSYGRRRSNLILTPNRSCTNLQYWLVSTASVFIKKRHLFFYILSYNTCILHGKSESKFRWYKQHLERWLCECRFD